MEVGPQVVAHGLEALGAQSEEIPLVRISAAERTGELFVPAGALDAGQEMARNNREQLQRGITGITGGGQNNRKL